MKLTGSGAIAIAVCPLLIFSGVFLSSTAHAGAPTPAVISGSTRAGLQLALADAQANKMQALAAAGNNKAARKAAASQYKEQIKAIKKAIAAAEK